MRRVFLEKKRNIQDTPHPSISQPLNLPQPPGHLLAQGDPFSISFAHFPAGLQGGREALLDHEALQEAHLLQLLPHHADGRSEARPLLRL